MIGSRKRGLAAPFQTIPLSAIAALALKIYFIDSLYAFLIVNFFENRYNRGDNKMKGGRA